MRDFCINTDYFLTFTLDVAPPLIFGFIQSKLLIYFFFSFSLIALILSR